MSKAIQSQLCSRINVGHLLVTELLAVLCLGFRNEGLCVMSAVNGLSPEASVNGGAIRFPLLARQSQGATSQMFTQP